MKYRIQVRVNDVTGDRMYFPERRRPEDSRWWTLDDHQYDSYGSFVEGVWTLGWAESAIEKQKISDAWRKSHYLNDNGTVDNLNRIEDE